MSRSGYSEDGDQWAIIRWRGAVRSAVRGRRGQAFLKEMLVALDSLPAPRLIDGELEADGEACALGSVGKSRGIEMAGIDPENQEAVSYAFGIPPALAAEIMYINDEAAAYWIEENPEQRWWRVREWVARHIAR